MSIEGAIYFVAAVFAVLAVVSGVASWRNFRLAKREDWTAEGNIR